MPSLSDLGPGWIGFGPIGGPAGALVAAGQIMVAPWKHRLTWKRWWRVRHCGVVVSAAGFADSGPKLLQGARMVQAMPGGVEEITLTADRHWTADWIYILPKYKPGQADLVAEIARRQARKRIPYSFECYPAIALHRFPILPTPNLTRWLGRTDPDGDPRRVICSWQVDSTLTLAGGLTPTGRVFNDGRAPNDVVPSELYLRLLELGPAEVISPKGLNWIPRQPGTRHTSLPKPFVPGDVLAKAAPIPGYLL